jgi:hypothetical protein
MAGMKGLAAVVALFATASSVFANELSVTEVVTVAPRRLRMTLAYRAKNVPRFRVVPSCAIAGRSQWMLATSVHVLPREGQAIIELDDDLGWLASPGVPCQASGLAVEMLDGTRVVSHVPVPLALPPPAIADAPASAPRLRFAARKLSSRPSQTSAAGFTWALNKRMQVELAYERTNFRHTSPRDTENGLRTSLRVGF